MNRCPSCRSLVPAAWIACRRCGAALSAARPSAAVPRAGTIMLERRAAAPPRAAPVHAAVPPRLPAAHDTLLPWGERGERGERSERSDSLLPSASRMQTRRLPLSRPVALTIACALAALALIVLVVGRSPSSPSNGGVAPNDPQARTLLLRVTDAAQVSYIARGNFTSVTPAALARGARGVPVVSAATAARAGQVSVQVVDPSTFVAATPGADDVCVFVRVQPGKSRTGYAATGGRPCRAAGAPTQGWRGA